MTFERPECSVGTQGTTQLYISGETDGDSFLIFDTDPYGAIVNSHLHLPHQFLIFVKLKATRGGVRQLTVSSQCAA